mmetsp:Transcript_16916/g.26287  ORF Transcript_16916/g.26287 Transcript_16916/m.26287 type:complete len:89 (-) Transcript_16916:630-896(-)
MWNMTLFFMLIHSKLSGPTSPKNNTHVDFMDFGSVQIKNAVDHESPSELSCDNLNDLTWIGDSLKRSDSEPSADISLNPSPGFNSLPT